MYCAYLHMLVQDWLQLKHHFDSNYTGINLLVNFLAAPNMYDVKSEKLGLILYNPSDREGAVEEADNLQSGL